MELTNIKQKYLCTKSKVKLIFKIANNILYLCIPYRLTVFMKSIWIETPYAFSRSLVHRHRLLVHLIIIIVVLWYHSNNNLISEKSFLFQIQLYGYNTDLYSNMSEAQMKSQGIVGVSLMVQVSSENRFFVCFLCFNVDVLLLFFFLPFRFLVTPFRSDKRRIRSFKWSPTNSANFCTKVSTLWWNRVIAVYSTKRRNRFRFFDFVQ